MKSLCFLLISFLLSLNAYTQLNSIPEDRLQLVQQFLAGQKEASGFFMLASHDSIIMTKGVGYADRKTKTEFTDKTLYSIGSITKPFTATAMMLLYERGKIRFDDPITKYFTGVPEDKKGITLHHLLTHSSGLPGAIGDDYVAITTEEFQKLVWNTPLEFKPGEGYAYSNVGYSLLGMIIEKISGESYDTFLQKNIFKPAGMETAGYTNPNADYSQLAQGYFPDGRDWGNMKDKTWNGTEPYWHLKANGGILMSAQDLFHWYLALRNNKVLKPESLKLQTTPYVKEGDDDSYYSYGYAVSQDGSVVQHNGGNRIFKADFRWFPKADFVLISVSNDANTRLFMLNDQIMDILMTGQLPEVITWQNFPVEKFPDGEMQVVGKKFVDLIQHYTTVDRDKFISQYLSEGIKERNDNERLNTLFEMLSQDIGQGSIQKVEVSGKGIQITLPAHDAGARLRLKLFFQDDKIDRIGAEMEGR